MYLELAREETLQMVLFTCFGCKLGVSTDKSSLETNRTQSRLILQRPGRSITRDEVRYHCVNDGQQRIIKSNRSSSAYFFNLALRNRMSFRANRSIRESIRW